VFQKFQQVDGTTTREYEGTGLGLSISKNLVKLMGGTIAVESELDKGSTFTITLALAAHADLKPVKHIPIEIIGANILIVDDNQVNRNILREQVKHWKCRSVAVERRPELAAIPTILLTSVNADESIRRLQKQGLAGVLTKPARSSQLLDMISRCLFDAQQQTGQADPVQLDNQGANLSDVQPNAAPQPRRDKPRDIERRLIPRPVVAPQQRLDILIAEDNETNQIYMKYIMEQLGVSFKIVPNGRAALDYWRSESPQVILMDISMPEMNGYEATKAIRQDEHKLDRPRTPIIAVTAHTLQGDEERCLEAGMDDYISKPVSIAGLKAILSRWMKSEEMRARG